MTINVNTGLGKNLREAGMNIWAWLWGGGNYR